MTGQDQRAEVRRLAAEGMSRRAIAAELGISRYKVGQALADQPGATRPGGRPAEDSAAIGWPPGQVTRSAGRPADEVAGHRGRPADRVRQAAVLAAGPAGRPATLADHGDRPADGQRPPLAGDRLAVPVDEDMAEHLATLMATGCTPQDAVRYAVATLADGYRDAITAGLIDDGDPLDVATIAIWPSRPAAAMAAVS